LLTLAGCSPGGSSGNGGDEDASTAEDAGVDSGSGPEDGGEEQDGGGTDAGPDAGEPDAGPQSCTADLTSEGCSAGEDLCCPDGETCCPLGQQCSEAAGGICLEMGKCRDDRGCLNGFFCTTEECTGITPCNDDESDPCGSTEQYCSEVGDCAPTGRCIVNADCDSGELCSPEFRCVTAS
jgi:hypothetical protein